MWLRGNDIETGPLDSNKQPKLIFSITFLRNQNHLFKTLRKISFWLIFLSPFWKFGYVSKNRWTGLYFTYNIDGPQDFNFSTAMNAKYSFYKDQKIPFWKSQHVLLNKTYFNSRLYSTYLVVKAMPYNSDKNLDKNHRVRNARAAGWVSRASPAPRAALLQPLQFDEIFGIATKMLHLLWTSRRAGAAAAAAAAKTYYCNLA